jgi:hypothetical protein
MLMAVLCNNTLVHNIAQYNSPQHAHLCFVLATESTTSDLTSLSGTREIASRCVEIQLEFIFLSGRRCLASVIVSLIAVGCVADRQPLFSIGTPAPSTTGSAPYSALLKRTLSLGSLKGFGIVIVLS